MKPEDKERFFRHMKKIADDESAGCLTDLTLIYEENGRPKYRSPKQILHRPRGKYLINKEIAKNNMEVEKVIRYNKNRDYGNKTLAMEYLHEVSAQNALLMIDMMYMMNPNILQEFTNYMRRS